MSATKIRTSCFSPNFVAANSPQFPGLMRGPNGTMFISSGILELDSNLLSLIVMEDAEVSHHMLLIRNFMSQGLVHNQPLLCASPSKDPRQFLGTLPCPALPKDDKSSHRDPDQEKGLRIAWQYKKYFWENQQSFDSQGGKKHEFCNEFDFGKPLERTDDSISSVGRIAIQSFCVPQCEYSNMVNGDKELEKLLNGNMVGLLNVHKVARINTQVHVILESTTFSINLKKRRFMVLECLNQVPIDGSSGSSYGTSSSCSVSSKTGTLDF
ncbi:hypothetical protein PRUPE_6G206700 [Prunus persica]|uniref:Elongator complex protein 4 n=1 Tax=Prunus persica TaxID=3760 RepID=M5WL09_PRUPE|nr:hypothetical protein PRUPE_6G206700 [Prunus persica]